jgi:ABC-type sugar transport system permease subunit
VVQNMYLAAFGRLQPGYGVAQAVILFPIIMFVAWLQLRLFKQEGVI